MTSHDGLKSAREYPLWDAIFGRRSRRVAAGATFRSGTLSFQSKLEPQPLSRLEEALLIAATGITGLAFADNPYQTTDGQPLLGTPLIEARGRAAGSPDNAQSTHFFMWNDEGTYLLKTPAEPSPAADVRTMSADELIAHAERCKVKVKDGRVDFPRSFPCLRERQSIRLQRAGQHDVRARHRGDAAVHQRAVLRARAGARAASGVPGRFQFVPAVRLREVGEVEVPEQGHSDSAGHLREGANRVRVVAAPAESRARGAGHGTRRVDSRGVCADHPARRLSRHRPRSRVSLREAERHYPAASVPGCSRQSRRARRAAAVVCAAVLQGYRRGDRRDPRRRSTGPTGCTATGRPPRPA